ncbi:MAG: DoxX family protein [Gemmatimonadales bacterium]|nr:DoxX family protein [Gemmatimonadales bacterium]
MAARRLGRARLGAVAIVTLSAAKGRMLNFDWFAAHRDFGAFFIRLAVGVRLIYGTADNVFSRERMTEFEQFLSAHGTPLASVGAPLSVYLQFVCGILFILGLGTRPAGALIAVNFVAALLIAHRTTGFLDTWPALMMLAAGLFFLFNGAGRPSIDAWRAGDPAT